MGIEYQANNPQDWFLKRLEGFGEQLVVGQALVSVLKVLDGQSVTLHNSRTGEEIRLDGQAVGGGINRLKVASGIITQPDNSIITFFKDAGE